jgi:ComF family protein
LFDLAWAAFGLLPPVQGLIHELKYSANFGAAQVLGRFAAARLAARPRPLPDLLIPVPLHAGRMRARGYNQAAELARAMAAVIATPIGEDQVRRLRATSDQIGQAARERRQNLRGAFEARPTLAGRHIALLDDVMTTGATLAELARACRAAGAARIEAWAIARAL